MIGGCILLHYPSHGLRSISEREIKNCFMQRKGKFEVSNFNINTNTFSTNIFLHKFANFPSFIPFPYFLLFLFPFLQFNFH